MEWEEPRRRNTAEGKGVAADREERMEGRDTEGGVVDGHGTVESVVVVNGHGSEEEDVGNGRGTDEGGASRHGNEDGMVTTEHGSVEQEIEKAEGGGVEGVIGEGAEGGGVENVIGGDVRGREEAAVGGVREEEANGREEEIVVDGEEERESQNQNMLSSLAYSLGLNEVETKQIISLWHNRTVVPPLDPAHLSAELARRAHFFTQEHNNFEIETRKALLREAQVNTVNSL